MAVRPHGTHHLLLVTEDDAFFEFDRNPQVARPTEPTTRTPPWDLFLWGAFFKAPARATPRSGIYEVDRFGDLHAYTLTRRALVVLSEAEAVEPKKTMLDGWVSRNVVRLNLTVHAAHPAVAFQAWHAVENHWGRLPAERQAHVMALKADPSRYIGFSERFVPHGATSRR